MNWMTHARQCSPWLLVIAVLVPALLLTACSGSANPSNGSGTTGTTASGQQTNVTLAGQPTQTSQAGNAVATVQL